MKNSFTILIAILLFMGLQVQGQRLAYVDSQKILREIPEYEQAQTQIDNLSREWEAEVSALNAEVDAMTVAYEAEKILLTPKLQEEKLQAIDKKRKEAMDLQRKYFGPQGDLFKKRQELIKPIQDQIYNAVQDVAKRKRYDMVIDKSGAITLLYVKENLDISDEVLESMGY
jgi:outer membrane protein